MSTSLPSGETRAASQYSAGPTWERDSTSQGNSSPCPSYQALVRSCFHLVRGSHVLSHLWKAARWSSCEATEVESDPFTILIASPGFRICMGFIVSLPLELTHDGVAGHMPVLSTVLSCPGTSVLLDGRRRDSLLFPTN